MQLLVRQLRLLALGAAIGALYLAPRSYSAVLPGPRRRLWEVWPRLNNSMIPCWQCGKPRWGEDLAVFRRLWGGSVAICDECLKGARHGIPA